MPDFEKKLYKKTGYKITFEPMRNESAVLSRILVDIHDEVIHNNSLKTMNKLEKLVLEHPTTPSLKNFLYTSYRQLEKHDLADHMLVLMNNTHPDYLFGKFNKAHNLISSKKFEEAKEILGENLEISDIVDAEQVLHYSEYLGYYEVAGLWYNDQEDSRRAEDCFNKMCEVDKSHRTTIQLGNKIIEKRLKGIGTMSDHLHTREVKTFPKVVYEQTTKSPTFNHSEIELLYQTNFDNMDKDWIEIILSLPRQTLIEDLENTLEDAICRYNFYENKEWNDDTNFFSLHAIVFLCHLRSVESLPKIYNFFRQGEDFTEFWLGDYMTEDIPYAFLMLGFDNALLPDFKAFVLEKNVYNYAKTNAITYAEQLAQHRPENRATVLAWFESILQEMIDNQADDDLIDTVLIMDLLTSLIDLRAVELIELCRKTLETFPELNKEFRDWEKDINLLPDPYRIIPIPLDLEDFYSGKFQSKREKTNRPLSDFIDLDRPNYLMDLMFEGLTGLGDKKEEDDDDEYFYRKPQMPIINEPKIGRNDPCHCGSGKKYKKCHGV